jgi:hypothetical protein
MANFRQYRGARPAQSVIMLNERQRLVISGRLADERHFQGVA